MTIQNSITKMGKSSYIYFLIDPRNNNIKYIGSSANCHQRYLEHCTYHPRDNALKAGWLMKLQKRGLKPILIKVVKCANKIEGKEIEMHLINEFKNSHPLLNIAGVTANRSISKRARNEKWIDKVHQYYTNKINNQIVTL